MRPHCFVWLITILPALPLVSIEASSKDYTPAGFQSGPKSLQVLIRFPEKAIDGIVVIKCEGDVSERGRFRTTLVCYPVDAIGQSIEPFVKAVVEASRSVKLLGARVDGLRVDVWFTYSVVFIKSEKNLQIQVHPNHFHDFEQYGSDYSAPQRIAINEWRRDGDPAFFRVSGQVGTNGRASQALIVDGEGSDGSKEGALELISRSWFIPAMHEGQLVPARYVELFYGEKTMFRTGPPSPLIQPTEPPRLWIPGQ